MRAFILAVTGLAIGVAACGSYDGTSTIEVQTPASVAAVSILLPAPSLVAGQTERANVAVKDANGVTLPNRAVVWYSSSASVATVTDSGVISAVSPGAATVSAVSEGVAGLAALTVIAPPPIPVAKVLVAINPAAVIVGQTAQATVTLQDSSGNPLTGRAVTWQSGNPGVATVSGNGAISSVAPGTAAITAASEGKTASASLSVSAPAPVPVATVSVSPASSSLQVGATVQLSATTRDANNNVLTGRVVAWSSANAGIASVNSNGLVSGVAAGTAQVTASSEGRSSSATITVNAPAPVPVASVSVSPATSTLQVGGTVQFSAVTRDANNNILTGRVITWNSNNVAIATVSGSGLGTAVAAGSTQINAVSEGQTGSATLTVSSPPPPPPPPPPGSSNEPAGMTVITDRPFNAKNELGWSDTFYGSSMSFLSDASAPHSPNGILRSAYPAGFAGGITPGAWDPAYFGPKKTLYIAVWIKHSSNFYGHPSSGVNKVFYVYTSNDAPVFYFNVRGYGTGDLTPEISFQNTVSEAYNNLGPNLVPSARIVRDQWNLIEVVAVGNSAGNVDGSVDAYLNGVHITHKAVQYESGATTWNRLACAPVWGGVGDVVPAAMWLDWDHVYVSGKN